MKLNHNLKSLFFPCLLLFMVFCLPQSASAAGRPGKVTKVKCGATTETSINISWAAKSNVSGYQVFRSSCYDGPFRKIKDIAPENHAFCNTGLQSGREYYYRVRAYRGNRTGVFSKILTARTKCASRPATVRVSSNVRKHAGTDHQLLATLNRGSKVTIICTTNSKSGAPWNRVSFQWNGKKKYGYIRSDLLSPEKPQKPTGVVIAASGLHLRKSASVQSELLATLPKGTRVTILKQVTGADNRKWYRIRVKQNGKTLKGYVFASYICVS